MSDIPKRSPLPRVSSSVYSDYTLDNSDRNNMPSSQYNLMKDLPPIPRSSRSVRSYSPLSVDFTLPKSPSSPEAQARPSHHSEWEPPVARDCCQLFPHPVSRQYPDLRRHVTVPSCSAKPPLSSITVLRSSANSLPEVPLSTIHGNTVAKEFWDRTRVYWNQELQEWRPVPEIDRADSSRGGKRGDSGRKRKGNKLKNGWKKIVEIMRDFRNSRDKRDRDGYRKRQSLRKSISNPATWREI